MRALKKSELAWLRKMTSNVSGRASADPFNKAMTAMEELKLVQYRSWDTVPRWCITPLGREVYAEHLKGLSDGG